MKKFSIGDNIRKYRELRKMKVKELAEAVNVSSPYMSQIENNTRIPIVPLLLEIAKVLGVSASDLLGDNVNNFISSNLYLIKGEMTWEQLSKDIAKKLSKPVYEELYSPEYLENFALGKEPVTPSRIGVLSLYAGVDKEFFYCFNTIDDLRAAKLSYRIKSDNNMNNEFISFAADPENNKFMEIAIKIKEKGINPEVFIQLLEK